MDTTNLVLAKCDATNAESLAIGQEIHPVGEKKGRYIKMLLNGTGSRMDLRARAAKAKAKGKEKERKVAMAIEMPNLYATIGARGMAIAATLPLATSRTTDLKEGRNERGKEQRRYRRKPSRKQRKKSWQW